MSKPGSRGSLMGLKLSLPAIPKVARVHTSSEMEQRIMGATGAVDPLEGESAPSSGNLHTSVLTDVLTDPPTVTDSNLFAETTDRIADHVDVKTSLHKATSSRKKEPTVLMNAKLPFSLHSRLKRTAQFNDISMTDILIKAIEVELSVGQYAAPPETWGSD